MDLMTTASWALLFCQEWPSPVSVLMRTHMRDILTESVITGPIPKGFASDQYVDQGQTDEFHP